MNHKKKEPYRLIVGIISVAFIVYMWVKKDIMSIYTTMPKDQIIPLTATTILVTLLKVGAFTGTIILIKRFVNKR